MVIGILAVYFLQGLTWTIYISKLAAVYHSELGHDVYSSGSHHVEPAHHHDVHNQQYVQVGYQIPVTGHQITVNHMIPPVAYVPVGHQIPVTHHYV